MGMTILLGKLLISLVLLQAMKHKQKKQVATKLHKEENLMKSKLELVCFSERLFVRSKAT